MMPFRMLTCGLVLAATACAPSPGIDLGESRVLRGGAEEGAAPMFAVSAGGARTVAWVSAPGGGSDGALYTSTDGGAPVALRDSLGGIEPHGEAPPKITYAPGGTLYALYAVGKVIAGRRFPFTTLRLAASRDGGRTWSAPRTVTADSAPGSRSFHALHAAADGSVYVAWLESRDGGRSGTFVTRTTDSGLTWSQAVRAAPGESCPCCRTAIATAPDGTLYLAWRAVMPGSVRDVVVASSVDRGATWSPARRVHADDWVFDGCPHAGPALLVDRDGVVHVAWWTGKEGAAGVYYARSTDRAASFGPAEPLGVAAFARPAHVQLQRDGRGALVAAWDDGRDSLPRVMLRVSRDGGRSFSAPVVASAPGVAAAFPVISVQGSVLTVAWSQQTRAALAHEEHSRPDMKVAGAVMPLPRVGDQRIVVREGTLR
jgi:hypothetical protein